MAASQESEAAKRDVQAALERLKPDLLTVSRFLHANPEVAYEERKAAELMSGILEEHGFQVARGAGGLPTAYVGRAGSGPPRIALLAEYDALPGLGHACGHNLIGTAALGAALALKPLLARLPGEIVMVGCPAEEQGGGKIALVDAGVFADTDAAMMIHPSNRTEIIKLALGMRELGVAYFGKASHAAAAPDQGINALDAAVLAYTNIGLLRQQLRPDARVHGIITHGGQAPNIIPEYAAARFYVRALDLAYLEQLFQRVTACCEAAARATGCRVEITPAAKGYDPYKPSLPLAELFRKNLEAVGEAVDQGPVDKEIGSSDVGNVSQVVPTIQPMIQVCARDVNVHMPAFAEAAVSERGHQAMLNAAKALAMTAVDLMTDLEARNRIAAEFSGADGAVRQG